MTRRRAPLDGMLPIPMDADRLDPAAPGTLTTFDGRTLATEQPDLFDALMDTPRRPEYDRLTVYGTPDGREALIVFEGSDREPYAPLRQRGRDTASAVRIGYLSPDGTVPPMLATEYAWHDDTTHPLTPIRPLAAPARS